MALPFLLLVSCNANINSKTLPISNAYCLPQFSKPMEHDLLKKYIDVLKYNGEDVFNCESDKEEYRFAVGYLVVTVGESKNEIWMSAKNTRTYFYDIENKCYKVDDYFYKLDKSEWDKLKKLIKESGFWEKKWEVPEFLLDGTSKRGFIIEGTNSGKYNSVNVSYNQENEEIGDEIFNESEDSLVNLSNYILQFVADRYKNGTIKIYEDAPWYKNYSSKKCDLNALRNLEQ